VWSLLLDRALARKAEDRFPDAIAMRDAVAAELKRLGMGAPRVELEAWLDNPDAWTKAHDARIIERLCQLGAASRKAGDAVSAAADYNRALAYAPNDPSLLRIVASMHRSEARARFVRRVAPLVLGAGVLGCGAYVVAKTIKGEMRDVTGPTPIPSAPTSMIPTGTPPAASVTEAQNRSPLPSGSGSSIASPVSTPTHVIATPTVAITNKVGTLRTIRFASLRPPFGVHLTIDGAAAADPVLDGIFSVDEKAHTLVFTCAADACEPKTVVIPAGEASDPLSIELAVPPARLVIEGEPGRSYGIEELPNLNVQSGQEATVPMMSTSTRQVTVFDRNDPTRKKSVTLHAGKQVVQKAP
jgi:hypothetical protein